MSIDKAGTITAVFSDTHIGGTTALSLPKWTLLGKLGEEEVYHATLAQKWIYDNFVNYWQYIAYRAGVQGKYRKHRIVAVFLGDVCDGVHHNSIQSLKNPDDQVAMASEIFTRVANLADGGLYMCIGTEVHAGPNGSYEYRVGQNAGAKRIDQSLLLDIDGNQILAYHHGKSSASPWGSSAAGIAANARLDAQENGRKPPRYVFTGHNHRIDDSGEKDPFARAVSLPCWQLRTAFSWKVAPQMTRSDIGGLVMLPDGTLDFSKMRYMAAPGQRTLTTV